MFHSVKFTLVNGYPKVPPKVEVEANKGLTGSDVKSLTAKLLDTASECVGQEMCHDLISATQVFLEANNVKPQTFYEAMISREIRESEALKKLRGKDHSSDGSKLRETGRKSEPKALNLSLEVPPVSSGAINTKLDNLSLVETSARDFRQSTDFISQQRALNKPSQAGKNKALPTVAEKSVVADPAAQALAALNTNMDGISTASSTLSTNPPSARVSGTKSWAKMLVSQANDEDKFSDADSANDGPHGHSKSNSMGDKNQLVPVIGRMPSAVDSSRYGQEFVEMSRLGSGASGQVWKVRNKLDRRIYAVKKIDLNAAENASVGQAKIRREVTTISRLLHKHIVRYYAAWVEESQHMGASEHDAAESTNVTATLLGSSATESGSSLSSPVKGPAPPSYMSNAFLGGNNSFMMGTDFADLDQANNNSNKMWSYDESEPSSPAPLSGTVALKPVKGSRFFDYGSGSSESDSDGSGSDSDSSSSSSDSSEDSDSSMMGRDSEVTVDRNSAVGIAANKSNVMRAANSAATKIAGM